MDRTALITGCSSGIGRATARTFLEEDWEVYATARDPDDIEDLAAAGCTRAELDVTDDAGARRVVDRVVEEVGRLDCLVNNAGYGQFGPLEDVPTDVLHAQFDVNVYGPHRLTRAALPHMREREDGTIVNVSSIAGRLATPGSGAYAASKFALEAMSDALRAEVDEYGIDVVLVEPGPVTTSFDDRADESLDDLERSGAYGTVYGLYDDALALGGDNPLASAPEDVADVIVEASCSPDPHSRYPVGPLAKAGLLARFAPDWLRDAIYGAVRRVV